MGERDDLIRDRLRLRMAVARSSLRRYPREVMGSLREAWESAGDSPSNGETPPFDLAGHDLAAVWLGHATALVRIGGINILTDPVFSRRIGFRLGKRHVVGPARLAPPPAPIAALPPIDLVLVSHAHYDHLDRSTLRQLVSERTMVVAPRRTSRLIPPGFEARVECDWGCSLEARGVRVSAFRPAHWGARRGLDRRRGYNSYLLEAGGKRVFFAGDTAETDAFSEIGGADLAIFGIGAYDPWEAQHATPEQVWRMFRAMKGERLLPIHHSTFELSDERVDEPLERLLAAAGPEQRRIVGRSLGEVWALEREAERQES